MSDKFVLFNHEDLSATIQAPIKQTKRVKVSFSAHPPQFFLKNHPFSSTLALTPVKNCWFSVPLRAVCTFSTATRALLSKSSPASCNRWARWKSHGRSGWWRSAMSKAKWGSLTCNKMPTVKWTPRSWTKAMSPVSIGTAKRDSIVATKRDMCRLSISATLWVAICSMLRLRQFYCLIVRWCRSVDTVNCCLSRLLLNVCFVIRNWMSTSRYEYHIEAVFEIL